MSLFQQQLEYFFDTMTRPEGVIGLLVMISILIAHFASKELKWWIMALVLWLSSLAFQINVGEAQPVPLAPPLQQIRVNARPLCLAMTFTLLIPTFMAARGWRYHRVGGGILALFIFQCLLAIRISMSDISSRGELGIVVFLMVFLTFGVGLGKWLQDWTDARKAVRIIVVAGLLFMAGTAYQLLMNRTSIIRQGRLTGTAGNAQHAGTLLALMLPPLCYMIIRRGQRYAYRVLLSAATGVMIVMQVWTGSRTSFLMGLVGLLIFFRTRIGRLLGVSVLTSIFVIAALQIYAESTATFTEMFTRGDTRSHVWSAMLQHFYDHLAFGQIGDTFGVGESSYLALAANMGLAGLIPMTIVFGIVGWQLIRLQRVRKQLGEHILLADLVTAGPIALATGAIFEGYLLGIVAIAIFTLYIYLSLLRFLLDVAEAQQHLPPPDESGHEPADQYQPGEQQYEEHQPALMGS
jgi:hypothetical protein